MNFNVFIFDYRGFGQSTGSPYEQGLYLDAETAFDYLLGRHDLVDPNKLFIVGTSLGCCIASYIASKRAGKFRGLVIENCFTNLKRVIREKHPLFHSVSFVLRMMYPTEEHIQEV